MNGPETITHDGVTLFKDTVIGLLPDTDKLITVGSFMVVLKEERDKLQERFAEVCDTMRVLVDEVVAEQRVGIFPPELARALDASYGILRGPMYTEPLEQQPYYKGHTAGQKWRLDLEGREPPLNPYIGGTVQAREWGTGFHDGYTAPGVNGQV